MANKLLAILVSLGLSGALGGVALSADQEIMAGGEATFAWAPASGPVDHYQVQVAREAEPPFSWTNYRVTGANQLSVAISSDAFNDQFPDVAHWALDENAGTTVSDSTGNGNTGNTSGTQWVSDTPTGTGSALKFDGVDDSVQVGALNVSGEALTIAMSFKADDFGIPHARLLSKATGTAEDEHYWMLSTTISDGIKLRFRLKTNGVTKTLTASSGTLSPGVWTHVALVYDGATMRIYKDGVQVGSTSKTGSLSTSSSVGVVIGNQDGSLGFDGAIDDVRIYGQALAQQDVAQLAAGTSQSSFVTIRTIAYDSIGNASPPSGSSATVRFVPETFFVYSVPDDFDGDSIPDVLTHDAPTGEVVIEESSTGDVEPISTLTEMVGDWEIVAQGDFDGDSREDLFWRHHSSGDNRLWVEVGANVIEEDFVGSPELANVDAAWKVLASGDFDGDGFFDLFWQNENSFETLVWFMEGSTADIIDLPRLRSASWVVEASADFDGSGTFDLLWRNLDTGRTAAWMMDGETVGFETMDAVGLESRVSEVLDVDGDGSVDLVWQREDGSCEVWLMPDGFHFDASVCPAAQ